MVLALRTFVRIVSNSSSKESLNRCFVWLQVSCVILLSAIWLFHGIFLISLGVDSDDYWPVESLLIMDIIGFFACFLFFIVMARVLLKSS